MRIKLAEHAVESRYNKSVVIRFVNVVNANPIKHIAEQIELLVSVRCRCHGA
jgi:hypothetical protein